MNRALGLARFEVLFLPAEQTPTENRYPQIPDTSGSLGFQIEEGVCLTD